MKWSKDISLFPFAPLLLYIAIVLTPIQLLSLFMYVVSLVMNTSRVKIKKKIKPFSEGHVAKVNNHEVIVGFGMPDLSAGMRRFFY